MRQGVPQRAQWVAPLSHRISGALACRWASQYTNTVPAMATIRLAVVVMCPAEAAMTAAQTTVPVMMPSTPRSSPKRSIRPVPLRLVSSGAGSGVLGALIRPPRAPGVSTPSLGTGVLPKIVPSGKATSLIPTGRAGAIRAHGASAVGNPHPGLVGT